MKKPPPPPVIAGITTHAASRPVPAAAITAARKRLRRITFDPAALFLLDRSYENLFEATSRSWESRCKGCGATVPGSKLQAHHGAHIVRHRDETRRRGLENLAKARKARGRKA